MSEQNSIVLTCTDEDMIRLKEIISSPGSNSITVTMGKMRGILARMEAAEDLMGIPIGSTTWKERHERWREKAGK